ncbi:hypothetical protein [Micromonospora cathayae]|uniref:SH3 domain-containing protein n=1 Tax=Micromonospora cathayae TaxID=3028804 RepID=A0ABY7ZSJ0_9ACTN|nr:hypothetical protein [Micromonospora sp. HUAS 3]WDZ84914.1 hypothetical protein PVK37_00070 [Micromonospora sp. HUAS 3]
MRRFVPAFLLAFVFVVGAPSAASAADSASFTRVSAATSDVGATIANCTTGRVESIATNLPIRVAPFHDAPLITTAQVGYQYNCSGWYALGDRYTACGTSNANGWLEIAFSNQYGYTYMTCLKDV